MDLTPFARHVVEAIKELIIMKDDNGNTPLHLGTMEKYPKLV